MWPITRPPWRTTIATFAEDMHSPPLMAYIFLEAPWRPRTPDMQVEVEAICERLGIAPPNLLEKPPMVFPTSDQDISALDAVISTFTEPWHDTCNEFAVAATNPDSDRTTLERNNMSPCPLDPRHKSPFLYRAGPGYSSTSDIIKSPRQVLEAWTPDSIDFSGDTNSQSSPSICPSPPVQCSARARRYSDNGLSCSGSAVAPSKRPSSLHNHKVFSRPYSPPSMHSIHRPRFSLEKELYVQSSSTKRNSESGRNAILAAYLTTKPPGRAKAQDGCDTDSPESTLRNEEITLLSDISTSRVRCGRKPVPLGEWQPTRAPGISSGAMGVIEFWTEDTATGDKIPGTFLADRFHEEKQRSLIFENDLPFPKKKEKGFNLRILWPGYPEFIKKISIHEPLSECTIRDVRDWVFNALSHFIRTPGVPQMRENDFWRVGALDLNAIHLDDLVLVRLKQVGKGTWVPELDLLDWDRKCRICT